MNIPSDFQNLPQIQGAEKVESVPQAAGQSAVEVPNTTDEANLSAAAVAISQSGSLSDVRMDKVASMQAAMASGSYQVSSSDLAAKLLENMRSNIG